MSMNPYNLKPKCKRCILVKDLKQRPETCLSLACEHFTPCSKCNRNLPLENEICQLCKAEATEEVMFNINDDDIEISSEILEAIKESTDEMNLVEQKKKETVKIAKPGEPPSSFKEEFKDYYMSQWKMYTEYWGDDPTTYSTIHTLILLEIDLVRVNTVISTKPTKEKEELNKLRRSLILSISSVKKELPVEEARLKDEEGRSLSEIYERYVTENNLRKIGDVRRIFSPEAVTLAPFLPFNVNLRELIEMTGADIQESIELERIFCNVQDKTPRQIAAFVGFPLNEDTARLPEYYDEEGVKEELETKFEIEKLDD